MDIRLGRKNAAIITRINIDEIASSAILSTILVKDLLIRILLMMLELLLFA